MVIGLTDDLLDLAASVVQLLRECHELVGILRIDTDADAVGGLAGDGAVGADLVAAGIGVVMVFSRGEFVGRGISRDTTDGH